MLEERRPMLVERLLTLPARLPWPGDEENRTWKIGHEKKKNMMRIIPLSFFEIAALSRLTVWW